MKGEIGDIHVETEDKGKSFKTRKGTLYPITVHSYFQKKENLRKRTLCS